MRIAVNTRFLLKNNLEGYGYFIHEVLRRIVTAHPEHQFIFFFDRPFDSSFIYGANVSGVVVGPPARHPLLWKLWYDLKIPAALKKHKADVFVSPDGFCSLTTAVPQCLVVHDLSFLHFPDQLKKSHLLFYKRFTPRFLKKAAAIATVSQFSKTDIQQQYGLAADRIDIVFSAAKAIFRPVAFEEKQVIRNNYTGGTEYFLYTGAIHPRKNLVNLLKAFSVFKKRMQSNMKLVIAGRLAWKTGSFEEKLDTYKYRNDVVLTGYLPETDLAALTAAAYAMVYPSFFEGFGVPVLEAMQSGVPVITSANSSMQEVAGEAALYADPKDFENIASQLLLIYKDEALRSRLVEKGLERARAFSWDTTAALFWQTICRLSA
jgi:glycosyltransferase involved in cell wall biosynthesis